MTESDRKRGVWVDASGQDVAKAARRLRGYRESMSLEAWLRGGGK
jgi:hypothetical protein